MKKANKSTLCVDLFFTFKKLTDGQDWLGFLTWYISKKKDGLTDCHDPDPP